MTSFKMTKGKDGGGISFNSMILLSFLLHALALSIFFFSPSWPAPRWTFGPVYTVDLVSTPVDFVEKKHATPSSTEITGVSSRDNSVVVKKKIDKVTTTPISKLETHKKVGTDEVDRAIEDIKNRTESSPGAEEHVSSRGNVEMTMRMRVYYSIIWSKIREQWILPEGILPEENHSAIIALKILRNGTVADLNFEKSSGNSYFDESAVKAIKKASPFPQFPEWMREGTLEIGIRFHSSELR